MLLPATYSGVDKQQVDSQVASLFLHVRCETDKITPVGSIILLLDVTFEPSMSVSCLKEIDLAPF